MPETLRTWNGHSQFTAAGLRLQYGGNERSLAINTERTGVIRPSALVQAVSSSKCIPLSDKECLAVQSNEQTVYKISDRGEWEAAVALGIYAGSKDDIRDGFIHLSTAGQLAGTLARHYQGRDGLVLLGFAADELGEALRWEVSRDGELFPHLYATLHVTPDVGPWLIGLDSAGTHVLPPPLRATAASA